MVSDRGTKRVQTCVRHYRCNLPGVAGCAQTCHRKKCGRDLPSRRSTNCVQQSWSSQISTYGNREFNSYVLKFGRKILTLNPFDLSFYGAMSTGLVTMFGVGKDQYLHTRWSSPLFYSLCRVIQRHLIDELKVNIVSSSSR